jgi:hypothetical protein
LGRKKKDTIEYAEADLFKTLLRLIYAVFVIILLLFGYVALKEDIHEFLDRKVYSEEELIALNKRADARRMAQLEEEKWDKVVDGVHIRTGLHDDKDLQLIIGTCTACHSAKLITQNRATREGWHSMIKWMQETQGLGDLGTNEPIVLDYLAKYYAPKETGRRKSLEIAEIEWYILDLEEESSLQ